MTPVNRYTLCVLISALAGAAGMILTEILLRFWTIPALAIAIPANFIGGLFVLMGAAAQGTRGWSGWPVSDWLRLLAAATTTFALGFLLLYEAVDLIGSSKATLLGRLEVIFVVGLAVIFLGETWTRRHWLAGGLALVGAVIVNFDLHAFDLRFGLGELLALLAVFAFAVGIVLLKTLVDRHDGQLVTGFGLLLGAAMLTLFGLHDGMAFDAVRDAGWWAALVLLVRGLLLGISWVTYNVAMKTLGASLCSVLFLSVAFFTVLLQLVVDALAPGLGLRVPHNLFTALLGGVIIGASVLLIHREK
jgi:drug/metabolite transporter (DMT)-like permease